jgi:uncharacterized protein
MSLLFRSSLRIPRTTTTPYLKIKTKPQLLYRTFTTTLPTMSAKQEWLIIIPDVPNTLSKRMEVRPQHLDELKPNIGNGKVVFGGATLDEPLKEGQGMKSNGSAMIVVCETEQEARDFVKGDVYAKSGVWNTEKMTVMPFKSAVREAL